MNVPRILNAITNILKEVKGILSTINNWKVAIVALVSLFLISFLVLVFIYRDDISAYLKSRMNADSQPPQYNRRNDNDADTIYRGLVVAPEHQCTPYMEEDYNYSQSLKAEIVRLRGTIYEPYASRCFIDIEYTDIDHIVALPEAHDSGLCKATVEERKAFAGDLLNLTLADPYLNRHIKKDQDIAQWLPLQNRCWYAQRIVDVKRKYSLTVDRAEADTLESVLAQCTSTTMMIVDC